LKFVDARHVGARQVGEHVMYNATGGMLPTTSIWHYVIPNGKRSVEELVIESIINELQRHNHTVSKSSSQTDACDFGLSGEVRQFWAAEVDRVEGHRIEGYTHQASVKVAVFVQKRDNPAVLGGREFTAYSAANWNWSGGWTKKIRMDDGSTTYLEFELFIGKLLDRALIEVVKSLTTDEEFRRMLSEKGWG
jgi:hypothetical protein